MTNPFKQHENLWKVEFFSLYCMLPIFEEYFADSTDTISCYEKESRTIDSQPEDIWCFEAYLTKEPEIDSLREDLINLAKQSGQIWLFESSLILHKLDDIDWVKRMQDDFQSILVGRFFITNSQNRHLSPIGTEELLIESSRAFGTGEHDTTQGCIEAMELLSDHQLRNILDVGTGTGILAIAAAKLRPDAEVMGSDIDEIAISVASRHAIINNTKIQFFHCAGVPSSIKHADLIIGNILAKPLIELAPSFASILSEGGIVILSGFLDYQLPKILEAYIVQGLTPFSIINKNKWITLTCKKQ